MYNNKLPVTDEQRLWIDDGFERLKKALGEKRMLNAAVVLPTPEFFPEEYDGSEEAVADFFTQICNYMGVDRKSVDLEFEPNMLEAIAAANAPPPDEASDETNDADASSPREPIEDQEDDDSQADDKEAERIASSAHIYNPDDTIVSTEGRKTKYLWTDHRKRCAGPEVWEDDPTRAVICISHGPGLEDTIGLAAYFAHQLSHVILIGGGLIDPAYVDVEELSNLLTVYLGIGVFAANGALRFQRETRQHPQRVLHEGALSEESYGYALAKFAVARGEDHPRWAEYLSTNVREYYKRSREWLAYPHDEDSYGEI